jgi:hypothetical protein
LQAASRVIADRAATIRDIVVTLICNLQSKLRAAVRSSCQTAELEDMAEV